MKHLLGSVVLGAAAMVALVGCGVSSATPASPTTAPTVASGSASSPSPGASSQAGESPASLPSPAPIASNHADPGLEALLPAEVSGTPMQRSSATLAALLDSGGDRTAIDAFLQSIGKTEADGSIASGFDPTNTLGGGIFAFKISGADAAALLAGIVAVEQSDLGTGATTRQGTVGGKDVTIVSVGTGVNDTEWIYGRGDVVFVVHAADETHAADFLQAIL